MKTVNTRKIKDWIQIIAFLLGSIWAIYTFLYKEIFLPKNKYVSLTSHITSSTQQCKNDKCGIIFNLKLENNSNKDLFLLKDITYVYGYKLSNKVYSKKQFKEIVMNSLNEDRFTKTNKRYSVYKNADLIFCGSLFSRNYRIISGNIETKEIIIHYPKDEYDYLIFKSRIPKVNDTTNIFMKYRVINDGKKSVYEINSCTIINSDTVQLSYKNRNDRLFLDEKFYSQIQAVKIVNLWE